MESFRRFNRNVKRYLVDNHAWEHVQAQRWIDSHTSYMSSMYESSSPEKKVAELINNMKEN